MVQWVRKVLLLLLSVLISLWNHFPIIKRQVLRYYDSIAGTGLRDQMRDKRVHLSRKISGSLAKFNLSVADDPVVLRARVLQAPVIQFDRHQTANVANGSFNLRGVSFPRWVSSMCYSNSPHHVLTLAYNQTAPVNWSRLLWSTTLEILMLLGIIVSAWNNDISLVQIQLLNVSSL